MHENLDLGFFIGYLMARIRTIKPEFFSSEDITSISPLSRLFYVSLWCESDREGRLEWKPGTFKLRYFPADNCDISAMTSELVNRGLIVLYTIDDRTFAEIPTFKEHQVINNRESESTILPRVKVASQRVKAEGRKEGREGKERKDEIQNRPNGVSDSVWNDFLKIRKAKKAPLTETAMLRIEAEASKAGYSIEQALQTCCARGWQSFDADWVTGKKAPLVEGGLLPGAI